MLIKYFIYSILFGCYLLSSVERNTYFVLNFRAAYLVGVHNWCCDWRSSVVQQQ